MTNKSSEKTGGKVLQRKKHLLVVVILLLIGLSPLMFGINTTRAAMIIVPDDYGTIQEAISHATIGDTVFVRSGTYAGPVVIDRSLTLKGENRISTIIDGGSNEPSGSVLLVTANNVNISGFTIQNSRAGGNAIWIDGYANITISSNVIDDNGDGIRIVHSSGDTISDNIIEDNPNTGLGFDWAHDNIVRNNTITNNAIGIGAGDGAGFEQASYNMTVYENTISGNGYGILIAIYDSNFFHNNILGNGIQASLYQTTYANTWDDGYPSGGNYWSDYAGVDTNSDGIGDTPYVINSNNIDMYPLMNPWKTPSVLESILNAPAGEAFFVYADPHRMTRAEATYDVASGSLVYGMCENLQNQSFDNNPAWVSQDPADRGRLVLTNKTVLMFGGPNPHWCVSYLEEERLTPVYFSSDVEADGTHIKFIDTLTETAIVDRLISYLDLEHEDYFVIMTLTDRNNNTVFISYGFDWKGTWASGIYLKSIQASIHANPYKIFHWVDANQNGIPEPAEIAPLQSEWLVEDFGGSYEIYTNGTMQLQSPGGGSLGSQITLYKPFTPATDYYEVSIKAKAIQFDQATSALFLRASLPIAGSTDGVNFEFGDSHFLLARWTDHWVWNVFGTSTENQWYILKLKVNKDPFTITAEAYYENGTLIASQTINDMTNFGYSDIQYIGFGVWNNCEFVAKDFKITY